MTIRVAVIGGGYFARYQIRGWLRLPDVQLAAIIETDTTKHKKLTQLVAAEGSPQTVVCDSLDSDQLSALQPLNVIDIATPPNTHSSLISEAVAKQCSLVICQKPFCDDQKTANEIFKKYRNSSTKIVVHENFRFQPWFRAIKELLNHNSLGEVLNATFRLRPGDGQGEDAYLDRQPYFRSMEKFLIHETGIHYIDVFRYLFGEPLKLNAELTNLNPAIIGEDSGHFTFYYASGLRAQFDGNRLLDHAADNTRLTMGEMLIEGTMASLTLKGNGDLLLRKFGEAAYQRIPYELSDIDFGGDCVHALQKHVVNHFTTGDILENELKDYLVNIQLESLVYQSAKEHRQININHTV